jgi:hypothetical protein
MMIFAGATLALCERAALLSLHLLCRSDSVAFCDSRLAFMNLTI